MKKLDKNCKKIDLQIGKQILDQIHNELLPTYIDFLKQMQIKDKNILYYMYVMECYGNDLGVIEEYNSRYNPDNESGVSREIKDEKNGTTLYEHIKTSDYIKKREYLGFDYAVRHSGVKNCDCYIHMRTSPSTFKIISVQLSDHKYLGYYDHDGNEISECKENHTEISFNEEDGYIKAKLSSWEAMVNDDPKGDCKTLSESEEEYQFDKPIGYVSMYEFDNEKGYKK